MVHFISISCALINIAAFYLSPCIIRQHNNFYKAPIGQFRMRAENFGVIKSAPSLLTKNENLELFGRICNIRYFEEEVKKAYDAGLMQMPVYLAIGQEAIPAALSIALKSKSPSIFAQHRAHGTYIAFGGDLRKLADELLHRDTGCAKGMGGSASIHSPEIGRAHV